MHVFDLMIDFEQIKKNKINNIINTIIFNLISLYVWHKNIIHI